MTSSETCSQQSIVIKEELHGTAPGPIECWICIEFPKAWPPRFNLKHLDLSPSVRALAELSQRPAHKLILIRRRESSVGETNVFVIHPKRALIRHWSLKDNAEIPDWSKRLASEEGPIHKSPLVLVCTHGSRDRCCGVLGGLTYAAFKKLKPNWVWQSSHLGGHRFAPTLLSFPSGIMYGRLGPEHAEPFLRKMADDLPYGHEFIRGNTRHSKAGQVALLHKIEKELSLLEERVTKTNGTVVLKGASSRYSVNLEYLDTGKMVYGSCNDSEARPLYRWVVTDYSTVP